MTLSKRERTILYFCIAIGVVATLYVYIIEPKIKGWKLLCEQIRTKELKLERDLRIVARQQQLERKFANIKERLKTLSSNQRQAGLWLRQLENLAKETNIQISNIQPLSSEEYNFYKKSTVNLIAECDLSSLTKFLYKIQNLPQLINIETLQITPATYDASLLKVEMLISSLLLSKELDEKNEKR